MNAINLFAVLAARFFDVLLNSLALYAIGMIFADISVESFRIAVVAAMVLSVTRGLFIPILVWFRTILELDSLLRWLIFILFGFLCDILMFLVTIGLTDGVEVAGMGAVLGGAVFLTIISILYQLFFTGVPEDLR